MVHGCVHVDEGALEKAMAEGAGRAEVYAQWHRARRDDVRGSPHLFTAGGYAEHNPGVDYHWTAPLRRGIPPLRCLRPRVDDSSAAGPADGVGLRGLTPDPSGRRTGPGRKRVCVCTGVRDIRCTGIRQRCRASVQRAVNLPVGGEVRIGHQDALLESAQRRRGQ